MAGFDVTGSTSNYEVDSDAAVYQFIGDGLGSSSKDGIFEAYSQWVLGAGEAFNLSNEYSQKTNDFKTLLSFRSDLEPDVIGPYAPLKPIALQISGFLGGGAPFGGPDNSNGGNGGDGSIRSFEQGNIRVQSITGPTAFPVARGQAFDPLIIGGQTERFFARLPIPEHAVLLSDPTSAPAHTKPQGATDRPIIMAVIDDSLNIAHERFTTRMDDGSTQARFEYVWVQDGVADTPSTVLFGRDITRQDIEDQLNAPTTKSDLDVLRHFGMADTDLPINAPSALNLSVSHGTFVADMAAGFHPQDPAGRDMRLIGVQLPILASQDTSGLSLIGALVAGIRYVFDRALLMSQAYGVALPVVLNFSYGIDSGPRNGQSILERAIKKNADKYRDALLAEGLSSELDDGIVQIVVPAGNGHLSRTHVGSPKAASDGEHVVLDTNLRLQPFDRTASFAEFWLPEAAERFALTLTLPDGAVISWAEIDWAEDFAYVIKDKQTQDVIGRLKIDALEKPADAPDAERPHHWRLTLCLAPTTVLDGPRQPAPAGVWGLHLSATLPNDGEIVGWILRDQSVSGFGRRGRQAYFDDAVYEESRFNDIGDIAVTDSAGSTVRRDGTLSAIATLETDSGSTFNAHVAGGFVEADDKGALYSAADARGRSRVTVALPVESSRAATGQLGAATLSGSARVLNGTSLAAPQLSRFIAHAIQHHGANNPARFDVYAYLASHVGQGEIRQERSRLGLLPGIGRAMANELRRPYG